MPRSPREGIGFVLGFWIALVLLAPLGAPGPAHGGDPELDALERDLLHAVNQVRREHGRLVLERDPDLDRVAHAHSQDMAARGYLSHESPEGTTPVDRVRRAGVEGFSLLAENVGFTRQADPNRQILQGWLRSPRHRANLLAPAFNRTGIGIRRSPDGSLYYTQLYATFPREPLARLSPGPEAVGRSR